MKPIPSSRQVEARLLPLMLEWPDELLTILAAWHEPSSPKPAPDPSRMNGLAESVQKPTRFNPRYARKGTPVVYTSEEAADRANTKRLDRRAEIILRADAKRQEHIVTRDPNPTKHAPEQR